MPVQIGRQIGAGGQGTVYEVIGRDDLLVKVLRNSPRDREIESKLLAMIRHNLASGLSVKAASHVSIAWPQQVVRCGDGRVGYTMYYARDTQPLFLVAHPGEVAKKGWKIDAAFLRRVAHNVAATVGAIHDAGYVIGDLNESNIRVTSRGRVTFIDTDSFQIAADGRLYRCLVKKWQYLAPELVDKDLGLVERDRTHDHFALGVIVFLLLMGDRHPYAGVWPSGAGDSPPVQEWIRQGLFAYSGACYVDGRRIEPPPAAPRFDNLDRRLRNYFERCFVLGHRDPRQRPSAREWTALLRFLVVPAPSRPSAPSVDRRDGSGRATWAIVTGATGYDLRWRQGGAWRQVANAVSPRTIDPLVNGTPVDVQVRGKNSTGASDWSPIGSGGPINPAPSRPSAPSVDRRDGSGQATWAIVTGATGYDLRWRQGGAWRQVANAVSPRTIDPLVNGTPVDVQVRAKNGTGASDWSRMGSAGPTIPAPSAPAAPRVTRGGGSGRAIWTKVIGATDYDVRWRQRQRGEWTEVRNVVSPRTIGPLVKRRPVDVQVRAKNGTGASDWSPIGTASERPGTRRRPPVGCFVLAGVVAVALVVTPILGRWSVDRDPLGSSDTGPPLVGANGRDTSPPRINSILRQTPSTWRTSADSVTWRIMFSEGVKNVGEHDFDINGIDGSWSLTIARVNDSNRVYDITLEGAALADHHGAITLRVSPSSTIEDLGDNRLSNATPIDHNDGTFVIDNAPNVTSIVRFRPSRERTNSDELAWHVHFNEPVRNVREDGGDFRITGAPNAAITVSQDGSSRRTYVVTLSGGDIAILNGEITLSLSTGHGIEDAAGNALTSTTPAGVNESTFMLDNAAPTVIFHPEGGRIGDGGNLILSFSEAVYSDSRRTAFTEATLAGLIDLREDDENGAPIPFTASIDPDNETVTVDPIPINALPPQTWVRVHNSYRDTVGNAGPEATATFILDTNRPTVTIDGVPDTDSGAFMAIFTFSEEVTGFTESDVRVANATASGFTEVQAGRRWHVRITPTGDDGIGDGGAIPDSIEVSRYGVWVPANQVTDLAGNGNTASTRHSGSYGRDVTDPRFLSIVRQTPSTSPAQADSITWRVTFSEGVQHFTTSSANLLEDRSDRVIRRSADRVSAAGPSESEYDITFGGLANYSGRVRLNFRVRSDGNSYSAYIQDKAARSLLCCETIGTDERTFDLDNAPAATERRRGSYGDVSTRPSSEPELDTALRTRGD